MNAQKAVPRVVPFSAENAPSMPVRVDSNEL